MRTNRREFGKLATGALVSAGLSLFSSSAFAQEYRYNPEHRRPVEATLHDLQEIASRHSYNGRERERYDNAIRHLHEFGERLHEGGRFDKDKLDQAIGDVQSVIDHNPMGPPARERLMHDVAELRRLREHWDQYHWR